MAKSRFRYRGKDRSTESVVRKAKQSGGVYDSYLSSEATTWKVTEGEHACRVLPETWCTDPETGKEIPENIEKYGEGWELQIWLHYNIGADSDTYLCTDKMKGEPCVICEARRQAVDEEEADALKPSWRAIAWVIDRDAEKAGPQIWSLPVSLFRDINARSVDKKTNVPILIDDPEEGFDIAFEREGSNLRTKYTRVEIDRDPTPVADDEDQQERWLEFVIDHPLPEMLVYYPPEHIEKVLAGQIARKDRDEDGEEEKPRSRRRGRSEDTDETESRSSRRRSRDKEEEPEEEERPSRRRSARNSKVEDPEEEAEEKPSRRRRMSKEEPEEEPEEGEEEEEPEEEESPRSRASSSAKGALDKLRGRRGR